MVASDMHFRFCRRGCCPPAIGWFCSRPRWSLVPRRCTDQNSRSAGWPKHNTIVNEFGQRSDGYAADPQILVIPSLAITGRVSKDGRRITWTNGTEWRRESSVPGPTVNINGRWFRNGQPTSIDVARDGRNFTIIQEWGLRATGRITGNGELIVPAWGVTGQVKQDGQRIKWSNGTEWTRPRLF